MEFFFCNKHKTAVKPRIHQNSAVSIALLEVLKSIIINIDFESWKLLHSSKKKVTWSNYLAAINTLSHEHLENISIFEGWGQPLVAYKCICVSLKNLQVLLKVFHKMLINIFVIYTENTQIKVTDSSSFRNKLFVVDSKMFNFCSW